MSMLENLSTTLLIIGFHKYRENYIKTEQQIKKTNFHNLRDPKAWFRFKAFLNKYGLSTICAARILLKALIIFVLIKTTRTSFKCFTIFLSMPLKTIFYILILSWNGSLKHNTRNQTIPSLVKIILILNLLQLLSQCKNVLPSLKCLLNLCKEPVSTSTRCWYRPK